MRHRLATIYGDNGPRRLGFGNQVGHRQHGPGGIGDMGEASELHLTVCQLRREIGAVDAAIRRQTGDAQLDTHLIAQNLPGNDIGVMFQRRNQNGVARLQMRPPPGGGDQVQPFGRPAHEDDFLVGRGINEPRHLRPHPFIGIGRIGRELINPPVDIGVAGGIKGADRLDHAFRLLRRCAAIEIGNPGIGASGIENREIRLGMRTVGQC